MPRYILIDNQSGYIWGDIDAKNPVEACRIVDTESGCSPRQYDERSTGFRPASNETAYHVYEGTDAIPNIETFGGDGTSEALIEAVTTFCRKVEIVTVRDEADDPIDLYEAFQ